MAVEVQSPARKPREGGIKAVVGDFVLESRLSVSQGGVAWEDSGCGLPSLTRAGCYATALAGTNEVQRLTITGAPTGGTFTLTYAGQTTTALNHNASVATIQAALEALSNVDPGDIVVAGGPLPGTFVTFTFANDNAEENVPQITVAASLTGGTTPAAAITTTTAGVPAVAKDGDGVDQYTSIGPAFAQYKGVECFIGGDSLGTSYQEQASAALEAGEDRQVESVLWEWAKAAPTPGTGADYVAAIALADKHADRNYVGQPVIIMGRGAAVLAKKAGALDYRDGELVTANGTPVLATGSVLDADEDNIVVVGMPIVWASPSRTYLGNDLTTNVVLAIAERVYAVGVDCNYRYAVTVTTP